MVTAVATTSEIHVYRDTPSTQSLDLETGGTFNAENLETALDKTVKLTIENQDALTRTIRIPQTDDTSIDMELPSSGDRADKFLTFGSNGEPTATTEKTTGTAVISAFGETLIDDANAAAARVTLLLTDGTTLLTLAGVQTKGQPYHDVKAYGAVGDGVTDDTAAIQAAIDAAELAGEAVYVPTGIYLITSSLDVTDDLKTIYGDGNTSEIRANAAIDAIFDYTSGGTDTGAHDSMLIRDIYLNAAQLANYCIYAGRMTRSNFIRIKAKFAVEANIGFVATGTGCFIDNFIGCNVSSSLKDGFFFDGSAINAINIIGCWIENNARLGINMDLGNKINIEGCTIEANAEAGIWALFVRSLSITNNYFEGNADTGIAVTVPASFTVKADIVLSGGSYPVIDSANPNVNVIIQGNNHKTGTADTMYYASGITGGDISNNRNSTAGDNCLEVYGDRADSNIRELTLFNNTEASGATYSLIDEQIIIGDGEGAVDSGKFLRLSHTILSKDIPHKNDMPQAFESYTKIVDGGKSSTLTRNAAAFHGLDAFTITKAADSSDTWGATLDIDNDYPELSGKLCYFGGWLKWDAGSDNNGRIYTTTTGWHTTSNRAAYTDWTFVSVMFTMPASGATSWECGFQKLSAGSSDVLHVAFPVLARVGDGHFSHLPEMNPVIGGTGEAGSPQYLRLYDLAGVLWYLFIESDGTVKIHSAIPTADADGDAVGDQTD
jgi:hypothetical protein